MRSGKVWLWLVSLRLNKRFISEVLLESVLFGGMLPFLLCNYLGCFQRFLSIILNSTHILPVFVELEKKSKFFPPILIMSKIALVPKAIINFIVCKKRQWTLAQWTTLALSSQRAHSSGNMPRFWELLLHHVVLIQYLSVALPALVVFACSRCSMFFICLLFIYLQVFLHWNWESESASSQWWN